jgi:hypothetical protein
MRKSDDSGFPPASREWKSGTNSQLLVLVLISATAGEEKPVGDKKWLSNAKNV